MKNIKVIITLLALLIVVFSSAQDDELLINKRWGFEKKFLKKLEIGDTLKAEAIELGSPIMFYQNGIFRRNPGVAPLDFSGKPKRKDKTEGKWAMKKMMLDMTNKKGVVYSFKVLELNKESFILVFLSKE